MALAWKRYTESRELLAIVRVDFRPSASDIVAMLGDYASRNMSIIDPDKIPPKLSMKAAEEFIRDQLYAYGDAAPHLWKDQPDDHYVERCLEWAREEAARLWPAMADDWKAA